MAYPVGRHDRRIFLPSSRGRGPTQRRARSPYSRAPSGPLSRVSRPDRYDPCRSRPGAPQPTLRRRQSVFTLVFRREGRQARVVVVVVTSGEGGRHWIITAYIARKLAEGEVEWA